MNPDGVRQFFPPIVESVSFFALSAAVNGLAVIPCRIILSRMVQTTAQSLHGSEFIATFIGGLLFGYFADKHTNELVWAGEGIAELLAMLTWVIFGSVHIGQYWSSMTADTVQA